MYTSCCTMNATIGTAWFRLGIWTLRGGWEGRHHLCIEEYSESHLLLEMPRSAEVEGGAPEQQMAKHQTGKAFRKILAAKNATTKR